MDLPVLLSHLQAQSDPPRLDFKYSDKVRLLCLHTDEAIYSNKTLNKGAAEI
jgi:hypothetical protein